jgi:lysophospholipase L1-like esterase
MRFCLAALVGLCVFPVLTGAAELQLMRLAVRTQADAPSLDCRQVARQPAAPATAQARDVFTIPERGKVAGNSSTPARTAEHRIALWGDSHAAAGFFSEELVRQLGAGEQDAVQATLPAGFGVPGVLLPVRDFCVSAGWSHEHAYLHAAGAARPGPGLVSMVSSQRGAWFALDLRSAAGAPGPRSVRLLFDQDRRPLRIRVSIDAGAPVSVELAGPSGPAALELASERSISTLRVEVVDGELRLQGVDREPVAQAKVRLDTFGFPGATVAGWAGADTGYLQAWFERRAYDLVALKFGTNEGNVTPLDAPAYTATLRAAVNNLRKVFPDARCLLIGPGDRGVVDTEGKSAPAGREERLRFSTVHEEINRIQRAVAQEAGCSFWSAQDAMGGRGSAFRWAGADPALMQPDLTHFTVLGYQRLAQAISAQLGWVKPAAQAAAPR